MNLGHQLNRLRPAWQGLQRRVAAKAGPPACKHAGTFWHRIRGQSVALAGSRYCLDHCLESALLTELSRTRARPSRQAPPHRVPLGLLLLSREQLSSEQLRQALAAQRAAGHGRIGEWLQTLGFVGELDITAALARQWSCPVLRVASISALPAGRAPQIPAGLLQSFVMLPVDYVASSSTLYMAFGERIDYRVLYSLEQMLACHTEACLAPLSLVRESLESLSETRRERESIFDWTTDPREFTRIVRSYCARMHADEIRLAACGPLLWIRLLRPSGPAHDLLLRSVTKPFAF